MKSEVGEAALEILGKTKSQLAYHALENCKKYVDEQLQTRINKTMSELKISGVRVDNTVDFYKEILKESKPYKSYISFPDGHGNMAMIFTRIRQNKTLQFLAVVINARYGILDAFGFNSMTERDFYKIVDKFYNYQEKYEIPESVVKHLLNKAVEISYDNNDLLPYEYICWESILLDIEAKKPELKLEKKELSQKDIDKLCLNEYTQNWFFDEIVSEDFGKFIDKLSNTLKENKYDVDLDRFVADNFDMVFTTKELTYQLVSFNVAAYLRHLKGDKELAHIFNSLGSNYAFLSNILRKSIYEYYVGKRYILKNQRKASNMFEAKLQPKVDDFELLQLDMIISMIETKWVDNA
jgi:hypothetical protein